MTSNDDPWKIAPKIENIVEFKINDERKITCHIYSNRVTISMHFHHLSQGSALNKRQLLEFIEVLKEAAKQIE